MIKKHESMIQYHLARVPFYNGKDSPEMANANLLKEKIAKLGARRHATAARKVVPDAPPLRAARSPRLLPPLLASQRRPRASAGSSTTEHGAQWG